MTSPRIVSRPAYATSCRSKARQAAPIERDAQSVIRAGSARITPTGGLLGCGSSSWAPLVRLVEVAALQQREVPEVVPDVEVELEVVLDDLGRRVALRAGVVGEGEHHELGVLAADRLESVGIGRGLLRVLRDEGDEPAVERQPALAVAGPELRRPGLPGRHDRQVDEVVGVA